MPGSLDESSGVVQGVRDPSVFWSHNDGGNTSLLIGFDEEGRKVAEIEIEARNGDWEDIARSECYAGTCFYLADTGDNDERRDGVSVLRLTEPGRDVTSLDPQRFHMVFPDGPRDVEAIYVLPGERLYLVTKGRNHPVTLYQYPGSLRAGEVELEKVQELAPRPSPLQWVTGASATLDGEFVVVRNYTTMTFYRVRNDGRLEALPRADVSLTQLREPQGEAVAFGNDGRRVILTSEKRNARRALMNVLECSIP